MRCFDAILLIWIMISVFISIFLAKVEKTKNLITQSFLGNKLTN